MVGIKISNSKSEAKVLSQETVDWIRIGGKSFPQVEEFKFLSVFFTSESKMEQEIDTQIRAVLQCCG